MKSLFNPTPMKIALISTLLLTLTSCKKDPNNYRNHLPTVAVAKYQVVPQGIWLRENATAWDVDRQQLTHKWRMLSRPEGSLATLIHPNKRSTKFLTDKYGTYKLDYVANDGISNSEVMLATVEVSNIVGKWLSNFNRTVEENTLTQTEKSEVRDILQSMSSIEFLENGEMLGTSSKWKYKNSFYWIRNNGLKSYRLEMISPNELILHEALENEKKVDFFYKR